MELGELIGLLRNPHGRPDEVVRDARNQAADLIESLLKFRSVQVDLGHIQTRDPVTINHLLAIIKG